MVPLGHRLVVRKMVPFGALFWCHFLKGHCFPIHLGGTTPFWCPRGTEMVPFWPKKAPFSKMVPQRHRFSTLFSLSEPSMDLWNWLLIAREVLTQRPWLRSVSVCHSSAMKMLANWRTGGHTGPLPWPRPLTREVKIYLSIESSSFKKYIYPLF